MKTFTLSLLLCAWLLPAEAWSQLNASLNPSDDIVFVCENTELNLSAIATGGTLPYTHQWSGNIAYIDNPFVPNIVFICGVAGAYQLKYTVTDAMGLEASDSLTIVVKPNPVLVTGGDTAVCAGQTATLTASGGNTILWFDEFDNLLAWTPTFNVTPMSPAVYTVVAVTNGCSTSEDIDVDVYPPASAFAGNDTTICEGSGISLLQSSASNYLATQWTSSGDGYFFNASLLHTTYIPGPADIASGSVILTLTAFASGVCPDATDDLLVTIQTPQPVVITGDSVLCEGNNGILTCSSGDSWNWSTGENTASILIAPATSQTYSVTATFGACISTDEILVNVFPYPVANAGNDTSVCLNDQVWLMASGGTNYLWSTGDTTATIGFFATTTQTYIVTVSSNGCQSTDDVTVTVNPLPVADAGPNQLICEESSAILTASGGTTYLWSTGENTESIVVWPSADTWYYVTVSNGTCSQIDSVLVSLKPLPDVDLGPDTTVCPGSELFLISGAGEAYIWSTGCTAQSIIEYPVVVTDYSVTTTLNGCTAADTIHVSVSPLIPASAGPDQQMCLGNATTLTASGGDSYLWSTGETNTTITVNPATTTTYYVTVTQGACTALASAVVQINPLPVADAGADISICKGHSTTLTASGGGTYLWSTGENTSSIIVSPADTTEYTVTVNDGLCENTDTVLVNVIPVPMVDVTDTILACPGTSVTLFATGAYTYVWEDGSNFNFLDVVVTGNDVISVTGFTSGCSATDSAVIIAWPAATANAGNDTMICEGDVAMLHASGTGTWLWSTGETTQDIIVSPGVTSTYYLTVTNGACEATDSVLVTVSPLPPGILFPTINTCPGDSVLLSAPAGYTYLWSNGETTQDIWVTPLVNTSYGVTYTNAAGCSGSAQADVLINPVPHASAGPDIHFCDGDTIMLCAGGGSTYLWNTGETTPCIFVSPSDTSIYFVTASNGFCTDTDSTTLFYHPLPIADAGAGSTILAGDSAILTGSGSSGNNTYFSWNPPIDIADPANDTTTAAPASTTTYTLFVYDDFGCTAWDTTTITVLPMGIYLSMSPDTFVCSGNAVQLLANVWLSPSDTLHYQWTPATSLSNDTIFKPWASPAITTTYYVSIWDDYGYSATDSVTVTVYKTPEIDLGPDQSICFGDTVMLTDINPYAKLWSTGQTTDTIYVSPTDTQTVILVVSNFICSDVDTVIINVKNPPAVNAGPDKVICEGDSVLVLLETSVSGSDIFSERDYQYGIISPISDTTLYYVFESDGCYSYDQVTVTVNELPDYDLSATDNEFLPGQAVGIEVIPAIYDEYLYYVNGQYVSQNTTGIHYFDNLGSGDVVQVMVTSGEGCSLLKTWSGILSEIPNAITPDGNGINDLFLSGTDITIINRWGQELYTGTGGWDGTYQGKPVDAGTYYYIVRLPNPETGTMKTANGSLLVIRY